MLHASASRENNFDFIRLVLAWAVIFSHCFPLLYGSESLEPLSRVTARRLTFGNAAVAGFFVLSGYLILQSWTATRSIGRFLIKRIRRIYPGFIVAALLSTTVGAILTVPGTLTRVDLLPTAAIRLAMLREPPIPGVFGFNPYPGVTNGSLWSISYEFVCYLGVLFLGVAGVYGRKWALLLLWMLLVVVFWWAEFRGGTHGGQAIERAHRVTWLAVCFVSGMLVYSFRERFKTSNFGMAIVLVVMALLVRWPVAFSCAAPFATAYLLFWIAFHPRIPLRHVARYGDFSYGMYLYAFPATQTIVHLTSARISFLTLLGSVTVVTLILAVGSWYLVESRFLVRKSEKHPFRRSLGAADAVAAQAAAHPVCEPQLTRSLRLNADSRT